MQLIKGLMGVLLLCVFQIHAQQHASLDTIRLGSAKETFLNRKLFGDSLSSSFYIIIRNEVKRHKHLYHSEQIVVQAGEATMTLGDKQFTIKKGDVVFIPKNTYHAVEVKSKQALKVVSIQAPFFDGTDRVYND